MGGYYSGRWHWYTRKTTVEECSTISARDYSTSLLARRCEAHEPVYESETEGAKRARIFADKVIDELLGRTGQGRLPRPAQTGQAFKLTRTPCHYGGYRYWLLCPGCGRRCGKLYKPYEYGWRYACRRCHDLTYTSAQEAHQYDRSATIGSLARKWDVLTRAELVMRKIDKCRGNSKNFWRLVARYEKLMSEIRHDA